MEILALSGNLEGENGLTVLSHRQGYLTAPKDSPQGLQESQGSVPGVGQAVGTSCVQGPDTDE